MLILPVEAPARVIAVVPDLIRPPLVLIPLYVLVLPRSFQMMASRAPKSKMAVWVPPFAWSIKPAESVPEPIVTVLFDPDAVIAPVTFKA